MYVRTFRLPQATVREIEKGGHQLNNDLTIVAKDITHYENQRLRKS